MSDVQPRPPAPRGRGSSRAARGGYGSRGARAGGRPKANGDQIDHSSQPKYADEGEIGELKRKYSGQLTTLKELFPDWTDEDIVFALQETDGDLDSTIERITEGSISQWGEVKKKSKERSRSKVQDSIQAPNADQATTAGRGARGGRGGFEGRGTRGRSTDRGRRPARGGRGGAGTTTDGARPATASPFNDDGLGSSIPTDESPAWNVAAPSATAADDSWGTPATTDHSGGDGAAAPSWDQANVPEVKKSSVIPDGPKKSWASMFAKPTQPPVLKNTPHPTTKQPPQAHLPEPQEPEHEALPPPLPTTDEVGTAVDEPLSVAIPSEPDPTIPPPKDKLTETNLEHVLDTSGPPATATQASTVASSRITSGAAGPGTPFSSTTQLPGARPPMAGYASSAYRAAGTPGRSASFQRRVLDQQEAVVMPNNPAVDRASVQFGSLGLNGTGDDPDVDDEREEAETRAQPPQHSPVAHPVASLPPAPHQMMPPHQSPLKESEPTPRQAPGLPVAHQSQQPAAPQQTPSQHSLGTQPMAQQSSQGSQPYGQFNRYAQPATQHELAPATQKPYDPFGHQANQTVSNQNQYEGYGSQAQSQQVPSQAQQQQHSHLGTLSSAPNDYSSYYTADSQQRSGYPNYYNAMYGQHGGQTPQDVGASQQRSGSGLGQTATDASHYPSSQAQQGPSRYGQVGESHTSGQSTPNPALTGQQPQQQQAQGGQSQQSQQSQHMQGQQPPTQAGGHGGYPYGHPYYSSPYYAAYMNQFGYNQGYGAPFGNKAGPYAQPSSGYGISPQGSYEHSSSPANVGGYGQAGLHGRDGGLAGGGLSDYGRSGSSQAAHGQQHSGGSGAFGGMADVFGRTGYQGQTQPLTQHPGNTTAHSAAADDSLKAYSDVKNTTGSNPSMNHAGRPESVNNNVNAAAVQGQSSSMPPSQSQQQNQAGYGGYPSHLNHLHHGSQGGGQHYGGLGGLGGHPAAAAVAAAGNQTHQAAGAGYGGYPSAAGYGGNYYASTGRGGGWGGNYTH